MSQRSKYILLESLRVLEDDENESREVPQGEILEEVHTNSDIWRSEVALFDARRQLKLSCPSKKVARLTDVDVDDLMRIKSTEERLAKFQARNCFGEPPSMGNEVFVVVKGRAFKGIVRSRVVSMMDDNSSLYGVQLFNEVDLEDHCTQEGTLKTCDMDVLCRLPNGGIGVSVYLDKLRPRNEGKEHILQTKSVRGEMREVKRKPCHSSLTAKEEVNEETKRGLIRREEGIDEFEKDKPCIEQISSEIEMEPNDPKRTQKAEEAEKEKTTEQQNYKKLELKTNDIRRELSFVLKAKAKVEELLQKSKEKIKELEAQLTMATSDPKCYEKLNSLQEQLQRQKERNTKLQADLTRVQNHLKRKEEPENDCDWNLNRKEIHLTEEVLGSGSFGTVYKGMFRGTQVAVKQVSVKPRITDYNRKNFRREMKMASKCRHPCMLQFIGATSDDQSPLLVTELLDKSLKMVLLERALDPTEITTIALDVAKGLNYLHLNHPQPIVHRDISSGNVLLWKHGQSWRGKISDYGNAVMMNYARTGSGGAIPYLAPEIDNQKFSTKSDVYSYGVLLLEMCHRKEPSCYDNRDKLMCLVEDESMRNLVRRCLQDDPAQRPSMEEVLDVLNSENL